MVAQYNSNLENLLLRQKTLVRTSGFAENPLVRFFIPSAIPFPDAIYRTLTGTNPPIPSASILSEQNRSGKRIILRTFHLLTY